MPKISRGSQPLIFTAFLFVCLICSAQDQKVQSSGMMFIPGGTVNLGIDSADIPHFQSIFGIDHAELFRDEVPKHTVTVQPSYMDKFPVTNAQFAASPSPPYLRYGSALRAMARGCSPVKRRSIGAPSRYFPEQNSQ